VLDPLRERVQGKPSNLRERSIRAGGNEVAFECGWPGTATAVCHARKQEQPGEVPCKAQSLLSLPLIVPALANLA
jgi:hypothetical protein